MTNLSSDFKVIGLSEIKASVDTPISDNIELFGYKSHHIPSNSTAGGVGIYVKSDLKANKRDDLSFTNDDFETIWIEINNSKAKIFYAIVHIDIPVLIFQSLVTTFRRLFPN